tara:strand:- start:235 stop:492 length:258 start_codon:yes stop_codon:yes gene_type:complete
MIRVKIGDGPFNWKTRGKTLYIIDHLMLQPHRGYDTIVIDEAHKYPNIGLFAKLCKKYNTCVLISGLLNANTKSLLEIADTFEKV